MILMEANNEEGITISIAHGHDSAAIIRLRYGSEPRRQLHRRQQQQWQCIAILAVLNRSKSQRLRQRLQPRRLELGFELRRVDLG